MQRVPETESQGRIHTSTATVAVMPEAEEVEVEIDPNDLKIDVYRSTGPGRPEREHDRLGRAHHAPADRASSSRCRTRSRSSRTSTKAMRVLRARLLRAERERQQAELGRDAALADRQRRARREDPHLQLPGEPRHRPPHQAHRAPARPDPRGRARRVHRGAHRGGPPPRARAPRPRDRRRARSPRATARARAQAGVRLAARLDAELLARRRRSATAPGRELYAELDRELTDERAGARSRDARRAARARASRSRTSSASGASAG